MKYILPILFIGFFHANCGDVGEIQITDPAEQLKVDITKIKDYLSSNNLTAQETESGLHYIIEEKGSGKFIDDNSSVNILLKGYFLDGEVFDETDECSPFTLRVSQVFEGFREGLSFFNVGGKGSIFIPSALAFGQNGNRNAGIPSNAILAYDFEIVDQQSFEKNKILKYLSDNNLTADSTLSDLFYIITKVGNGDHPNSQSDVTVNYRGYFLNGTTFDESINPTVFELKNTIRGWQEAIPLLKAGGSGQFFITSEFAYGTTGTTIVPGNTLLVFDIELIEFN